MQDADPRLLVFSTPRSVLLSLAVFSFTAWMHRSVSANPTVGHVIHISVDGLRGDLLENLIAGEPERYGNFKRVVDEGVATFNGRTDPDNTRTLPNHVTMLTGRPVLQPSGMPDTTQHGWTLNSLSANSTAVLHDPRVSVVDYVASTFDVAHDNGLSTAMFVGKTKFIFIDNSYNSDAGAPDVTGADDGKDKIDAYVVDSSPGLLDSYFADNYGASFQYTFFHFADPDGAGHDFGWGSPQWNTAVQAVDGYVGELFNLIEAHPTMKNDTAVIISSDHGGTELGGHSNALNPENYTVPVLAWGPRMAAGGDLYRLNASTRRDPAMDRPDYTAPLQPIRHGDTANLALDLLGLGPIPGSIINNQFDLSVVPEPSTAAAILLFGIHLLGVRQSLKIFRRGAPPSPNSTLLN